MNIYGLIGFPLGHSFSKDYFNQKFEAEHIDAEYLNFELSDVKELKDVLRMHPHLCGLNVTIPYKTAVMSMLDEIDEDARTIGAVNVIAFKRGAHNKVRLKGYNSDVIGFRQSLSNLLDGNSRREALILGTGGASKAVFHGLRQLGITAVFVSRHVKEDCLTYADLSPEIMRRYTLIVNTTPLGMSPKVNDCPDIPYDCLSSEHLLYDLVYNPDETLFLKKGKERGAQVKNGLEMLFLQAFAAWEIWQRERKC